MNVKLYTGFAKKNNSTKIPASGAPSLDLVGTLKSDCSVMNPVIQIERLSSDLVPSIYNYAYISDYGRYYYVTDVRWVFPFWEISMSVDVLDSYRTQIGASSHDVLSTDSTTDFNPMITDTMYPATNEIDLEQFSLPSPFTSQINNGIYVVGLISGDSTNSVGAVTYYAMTAAQFGTFKGILFGNGNLVTMGLAEFDPSAPGTLVPLVTDMSLEMTKAMYNPYQYVASCMWFPFPITALDSGSYSLVSGLKLGWWDYPVNGYLLQAQNLVLASPYANAITPHPQAATRGDYLNYAPYTRCTVYGIFGSTPLDLSFFDSDDNSLNITYVIDLITGQCRVRIESFQLSASPRRYHILCEKDFLCGVPIQLAQIATDYLGAAVTAVDAVSNTLNNALTLNVAGTVSSAAHGIYDTLNAIMPQMSTSGTNGSMMIVSSELNTKVVFQYFNLTDEDITHKGRPLCEIRQINTLSGYILCSDGEFDLNCLEQERNLISDFLTTGFFWE